MALAGPSFTGAPSGSFDTLPMVPPIIVMQNDGKFLQTAPIVPLKEQDRVRTSMVGFDSYLLSLFRIARYNPDALIMNKGYPTLYSMRTDATVRMATDLKLQATLYKKWQLLPAVASKEAEQQTGDFEKSQEICKFCYHLLTNIRNPKNKKKTSCRTVLWQILQAVSYGFSVNELTWRVEDTGEYKDKWLLSAVTYRRNEQVGFYLDRETLQVNQIASWTPLTGLQKDPIPAEKCIIYTFKPQHGLPYGDGDLRACYKHWWSNDNALRWWGVALRKWGVPNWEVIVDAETQLDQAVADASAAEQGEPVAHTRESEWKAWFAPGGTLDTFQTFFAYHNGQITKNILGNTLTTTQGDGSSSYALGTEHRTTENFFMSYPRHDVEEVMTDQVLERAVEYNFGEEFVRLTPRFFLGHWDDAERSLVAKFIETAVNSGVINGQEGWVREMLNIPPKPEGFKPDPDLVSLVPGRERIDVQTDGKGKPQKAWTLKEFYSGYVENDREYQNLASQTLARVSTLMAQASKDMKEGRT